MPALTSGRYGAGAGPRQQADCIRTRVHTQSRSAVKLGRLAAPRWPPGAGIYRVSIFLVTSHKPDGSVVDGHVDLRLAGRRRCGADRLTTALVAELPLAAFLIGQQPGSEAGSIRKRAEKGHSPATLTSHPGSIVQIPSRSGACLCAWHCRGGASGSLPLDAYPRQVLIG